MSVRFSQNICGGRVVMEKMDRYVAVVAPQALDASDPLLLADELLITHY